MTTQTTTAMPAAGLTDETYWLDAKSVERMRQIVEQAAAALRRGAQLHITGTGIWIRQATDDERDILLIAPMLRIWTPGNPIVEAAVVSDDRYHRVVQLMKEHCRSMPVQVMEPLISMTACLMVDLPFDDKTASVRFEVIGAMVRVFRPREWEEPSEA